MNRMTPNKVKWQPINEFSRLYFGESVKAPLIIFLLKLNINKHDERNIDVYVHKKSALLVASTRVNTKSTSKSCWLLSTIDDSRVRFQIKPTGTVNWEIQFCRLNIVL